MLDQALTNQQISSQLKTIDKRLTVIENKLASSGQPKAKNWPNLRVFCICVFLYSAQYLHILQDSKCYMTIRLYKYSPTLKVFTFP